MLTWRKAFAFWVEGLGLAMDRAMRHEGRLIGCMVYNEHTCFWINEREGTTVKPKDYDCIRLYWAPDDILEARDRLMKLGFEVSAIENRHYGQSEFFVTDDDGHSHCFGVATDSITKS